MEANMTKTLLIAAVMVMAGCSTVDPAKAPDPDVDHAYVAKVEQSARLGGAQVVWVQRPTKRTTATN
jgi:starvation-inducible outer membrane lipoprotein